MLYKKNKIQKKFFSNGYFVFKLFTKKDINLIRLDLIKRINFLSGLKKNKKDIDLSNYHNLKFFLEKHKKIIQGRTRYLPLRKSFSSKIYKNKTIRQILYSEWGHGNFNIKWIFDRKTKTKKDTTGFRLARPVNKSTKDVGGFHLDLHYGGEKNENKKALFTIWCPIIGTSSKYTLRISPKSHKPNHLQKFVSKQKKFLSPVLMENYTKKYRYIRPQLRLGEAIIFHPNLIHGGSLNLGKKTRVSIDFRLFNKKFFKN